jgi:hypothetical protein
LPRAIVPDLLGQRLRNQKLTGSDAHEPADVVAWLGAVQAQDYAGAKWAIGLRANGVTDADVERAVDDGAILRTHVMRPTWHFVSPADIRWMLALTAPRVHAANAHYYRKVGLDERLFARSRSVLERALRGGKQLTRTELASALKRAGIAADGMRLAYLMIHAELSAAICSGARRGKQFTYALLDERTPRARTLRRDEALAEMTRRYVTSHGPVTVRDYAWWSGMTVRDAKAGLEMVEPALAHEQIDGRTYWFVPSGSSRRAPPSSAYLLPNYDEYLIAYKDRGPVMYTSRPADGVVRVPDAFVHHLLIDGRLAGSWQRTVRAGSVLVEVAPYARLAGPAARALAAAAERYGRFMQMPVRLSVSGASTASSSTRSTRAGSRRS